MTFSQKINSLMRNKVLNYLKANDWKRNKTAEQMGISVDSLRRLIKKYDVKKP